MVEGHQCHRVAQAHRRLLLGLRFKAASPNGRFTEGASALDNKPLRRIEVHGKYLFYFFGENGVPSDVLHFHFGMSGRFATGVPGTIKSGPTTRLCLESREHNLVAHLSAMTVLHGGPDLYDAKRAKLGPDPLRADADADAVWFRVSKSPKPIGLLLMDQSVVAGIGNIYRAEILYKAGVHPEEPGNSLDRQAFDRIWRHAVLLLQRGFFSGSILTVDDADRPAMHDAAARRYIYNRALCAWCGTPVRSWDMNARTVYACPNCQPAAAPLPGARKRALDAAGLVKEFVSRCAPAGVPTPAQMTVAQLRDALQRGGLDIRGRKAVLVDRFARSQRGATDLEAVADCLKSEPGSPTQLGTGMPGAPLEGPQGPAGDGDDSDALLEKMAAGERLNVEHVALESERSMRIAHDREGPARSRPKRKAKGP